jgi:hypothetical protein
MHPDAMFDLELQQWAQLTTFTWLTLTCADGVTLKTHTSEILDATALASRAFQHCSILFVMCIFLKSATVCLFD